MVDSNEFLRGGERDEGWGMGDEGVSQNAVSTKDQWWRFIPGFSNAS
ncbi:MAG: hypothetical protein HC879_03790 [Leptolyngbyaceae cyanobacterium SL_5_9]|nr:hypothetical protein [Leptolyngbyaceae cyanobacterium SL_5_9]